MDRLPMEAMVIDLERDELERKLVRARQVRAARQNSARLGGTRRWLAGRLLASGLRIAPPEMAREWAQDALCERQFRTAH